MVQERNIAALEDIITKNIQISSKSDINIVLGTALSSILHYYDSSYSCELF